MIRYGLVFTSDALQWIRSAEASVRGAIGHALYKLQCDPTDGDVGPLKGAYAKKDGKPVLRLRVGSYRVAYQKLEDVLVISVIWIDKRGDAY